MRRYLPAIFLLACGERTQLDAGNDSGGLDAGDFDAGPIDAGPPPSCAEVIAEQTIAIDPDGEDTQIHAAAAFDGEGVWVAFNRPEPGDTGLFDVYATRLGCDGEPSIPIFAVQNESAGNDVDPEIAIANDRVFIAWNVDDGSGGTSNLQVRYRAFALDGTPMGDQRQLVTMRGGAPITENHLGADVAVDGSGIVIAGGRALPDVLRIQAYAQRVGADGAPIGEALEGSAEPMVSHRGVAIALDASDVWLVYEREPDSGSTSVSVLRIGDAPGPAIGGLSSSGTPDVIALGGRVWSAFAGEVPTGEVDLRIVEVSVPLAERMAAVLGERARLDHSPKLAASADALAIAWYRNISGIRNELWAAPIDATGAMPIVGSAVQIYGDPGAAPYQPALVHVIDDYWFVAWSQGTSPALRLSGRFVRLP